MNPSIGFTRIFFVSLSVFFMTTYVVSGSEAATLSDWMLGIGLGLALGVALIAFDLLFKRYNLRAFNIAIVGLFFGYLMGHALVSVVSALLDISSASVHLSPSLREIIKITLFLFSLYLGTLMALRASDELYVSIPFVRLAPMNHQKRDLLVDASALADARLIDLCTSGLFDRMLVLPRFLLQDLYVQLESQNEMQQGRAKRAIEVVKKLESIPDLDLRYNDTDFLDVKEIASKMTRLARLLNANLLIADTTRMQTPHIEGIKVVNLQVLSQALKPLMQAGERIKIKIQRYGKEPRQGVGYLDDGAMVVVNGGGQYLGETVDALVLSVKHTTSGRIIFCNAEEGDEVYPHEHPEE